MDRSNNERNFRNDRRNHGRKFINRSNNGKNFKNDRRNHESNSKTKKDNGEQKNVVSELKEELNEPFVKGLDISKENLDDSKIGKSKSTIKFDSTKLN